MKPAENLAIEHIMTIEEAEELIEVALLTPPFFAEFQERLIEFAASLYDFGWKHFQVIDLLEYLRGDHADPLP